MTSWPFRWLTMLLASACLLVAATTSALAADDATVTWGVRPADSRAFGADRAHFAYDVQPGDTVRDALLVTNHGDVPLRLLTYAADAFTTTSGQLDLLPRGERSIDLGSWVTTRSARVEVPAGQTVRVPFTLRVPDDATPGDHPGGIVTSLVTRTQADGIAVDRRLGSRIHVRVAGDLAPSLRVDRLAVDYHHEASPLRGSATVSFVVRNDGNVRATATGSLDVRAPFGVAGRSRTFDVAELMPGDELAYEFEVDRVPALTRGTAIVRLAPVVPADDGTAAVSAAPVTARASFWAVPWAELALLALVALGVGSARWRSVRRRAAQDARVALAVEEALRDSSRSAAPADR